MQKKERVPTTFSLRASRKTYYYILFEVMSNSIIFFCNSLSVFKYKYNTNIYIYIYITK